MSLRRKTFAIIGVTLAISIGILYIASRLILLDSFARLEQQDTSRNVQRVSNALADQLSNLATTAADWAFWDDTYAFVQDGNAEYIKANLNSSTLVTLNMNLMLIINTAGQRVFAMGVDPQTKGEVPVPQDLDKPLTFQDTLLHQENEQSSVSGFVLVDGRPALIAARPILKSDRTGPVQGILIFCRYLDADKIKQLSESLRLSLSLYRVDDTGLPADFKTAQAALPAPDSIYVQPLEANVVAGYHLLSDIDGKPVALWRVDMLRDIYWQGQSSLTYLVVALLVMGLVSIGVMHWFLERMVLLPVSDLSRNVSAISTDGDITERLSVSGNDELASLALRINTMLEALEQSQKTLTESDQRLRTIVNNAPLIIWAVDDQEKVILVDGKSLQLLDVDPHELIGRPVSEIQHRVPQLAQESRRALRGETVVSTATIDDLQFDVHYAPLRDAAGVTIGVIGIATDITERTRAQAALDQTQSQLEHRNQQLERVYEFFQSSLEQMIDLVKRGGNKTELFECLNEVQVEFKRLH